MADTPEKWALTLAQLIAKNARNYGSNPTQAQITKWAKSLEKLTRSKSFNPQLTSESLTSILIWAMNQPKSRSGFTWAQQVRSCPPVKKMQNIVASYLQSRESQIHHESEVVLPPSR